MGINKLNTITEGAATYEGKFTTSIIDGSNIIIAFLSKSFSELQKKSKNEDWNCPTIPLLTQLKLIVDDATEYIQRGINSFAKKTEETVYVIFDSPEAPMYNLLDGRCLDMKSAERACRKKSRSNISDKKETVLQKIKAESADEADFEFKKNLYHQCSYFTKPSNLFGLCDIIIDKLIPRMPNVKFLRAISEADLVIKNLAATCNDRPVLVASADSDYFVLLADLVNVYKTDIRSNASIFYPFQLWKDVFHEDIDYDTITSLATISGNDYTTHKSIAAFEVQKMKDLMNVDQGFSDLMARSYKIKSFIRFKPTGYTTLKEVRSIIYNHETTEFGKLFIDSLNIYKDWDLNFKFTRLESGSSGVVDHILKTFKGSELYTWDSFTDLSTYVIVDGVEEWERLNQVDTPYESEDENWEESEILL